MLLARRNEILTRERLIGSLWSFGHLNEPPMTETFGFGAGGQVTGYQNPNEASWSLEESVLHLHNQDGGLTWRFDIMFAAPAGLILIAQYQNDPAWRPFFTLIERAPAAPRQSRQSRQSLRHRLPPSRSASSSGTWMIPSGTAQSRKVPSPPSPTICSWSKP